MKFRKLFKQQIGQQSCDTINLKLRIKTLKPNGPTGNGTMLYGLIIFCPVNPTGQSAPDNVYVTAYYQLNFR